MSLSSMFMRPIASNRASCSTLSKAFSQSSRIRWIFPPFTFLVRSPRSIRLLTMCIACVVLLSFLKPYCVLFRWSSIFLKYGFSGFQRRFWWPCLGGKSACSCQCYSLLLFCGGVWLWLWAGPLGSALGATICWGSKVVRGGRPFSFPGRIRLGFRQGPLFFSFLFFSFLICSFSCIVLWKYECNPNCYLLWKVFSHPLNLHLKVLSVSVLCSFWKCLSSFFWDFTNLKQIGHLKDSWSWA